MIYYKQSDKSNTNDLSKINECKRIKALMRPGYKKVMKKYGWNIKHYEFQKELN